MIGRGDPVQLWRGQVLVHDQRFFARVLAYGNLGMGEAFMEGEFETRGAELYEFLDILSRSRLEKKLRADRRLFARAAWHRLAAHFAGKARSVQRHYDIGDDLFETFLDPTMSYSCGYAVSENDDLEKLQLNKLDRICRKLELTRDQRLLDIGCGYGGLLIYAAQNFGVTGIGVTISRNHTARANENIKRLGLSDRIRVEYRDFEDIKDLGRFDRVVSVGMFEHVPRRQYGRFFKNIARALTPDGRGLLHAIGCNAAKNTHDPFFQKYIFPGANQPRLSEITGQLERHGLAILDVENIALHYSYTVREWLRKFRENRHQLDPTRYDEVFARMWEYYFHCGIVAALSTDSAVYQTLFAADCAARPPLRRV